MKKNPKKITLRLNYKRGLCKRCEIGYIRYIPELNINKCDYCDFVYIFKYEWRVHENVCNAETGMVTIKE